MPGNNARRLGIYTAILFLFFIEVTIFNSLRIYGVKPELLLIATIFFGFRFGMIRGLETGLLAGALKDIFGITAFGVNTLSFLFIGCLAGFLREKLSRENIVMQFFFSNISVYAVSGIYFLYLSGILKCDMGYDFWREIIGKGLYTGCASPVIFFVLGRIFRAREA